MGIATARREKAVREAEAQAEKASVAAEALAAEAAEMRRRNSERQQAVSLLPHSGSRCS